MPKKIDHTFFTQALSSLINQNKLPHLFILSGEAHSTETWLESEVFPLFFKNKASEGENLLRLAPSGASYKLEDIENSEWKSFFSHRPTNSLYRVLVIHQSEELGPRVANRLLKDLEDTPPWIVIFMVHSGTSKVMATIKSRALTWRLPPASLPQKSEWAQSLAESITLKQYARLPELLREDEATEGELMELLHQSFLNQSESLRFEHCDKWLAHLKWWRESKTFNQAKWERLLPFCVFAAPQLER